MEVVERYLIQLVNFFMNNWIAAAVLGLVVVIAAIKKPKELFKVFALLTFLVGVLYVMIYIEKSMFSGVAIKKEGIDVERRMK